jgi:hypothetical protein
MLPTVKSKIFVSKYPSRGQRQSRLGAGNEAPTSLPHKIWRSG